jgi:hypothetical protein
MQTWKRPKILLPLVALGLLTLLMRSASAQTATYGLPADAKIIETQPIASPAHPNRALVLWMIKPERSPRGEPNEPYTCPEETVGHCYSGPVRVSLVNTADKKIINTLEVIAEQGEDSFNIPYKIHQGYYFVAGVRGQQEGKPTIMKLKDYNGDGRAAEFALFEALACMGLSTTLIGYSERQDRVIQYETDLTSTLEGERKTEALQWVDYLFSKKPVKPGYWKYAIDYRGRGGSLDQYEIRYNAAKERFEGTLVFKKDE